MAMTLFKPTSIARGLVALMLVAGAAHAADKFDFSP